MRRNFNSGENAQAGQALRQRGRLAPRLLQHLEGPGPLLAEIDRMLGDVERDVRPDHILAQLLGVPTDRDERVAAVCGGVGDRIVQNGREPLDDAVREVEARHDAAERHRRARQLLERCAQILNQLQAVAAVGEPALVDQHAEVVVAPPERRPDVREYGMIDPRAVRMQAAVEQRGRCGRPRAQHARLGRRPDPVAGGDDQRADAEAERRSSGDDAVAVGEQKRGVKAGLRDVVSVREEPVVQRLDVEQLHLELEAPQVDPALEDGVERERVVRARREAEPELHASSTTRVRAAARASAIRHAPWSRSPARLDAPRTIRSRTPKRPAATATANPSISSASAPGCRPARSAAVCAFPADSATESTSPSEPPSVITSVSAKPSSAGAAPPAPIPSMRTAPASMAVPIANRSGSYVPAAPTSTTPPAASAGCVAIAWAAPAPAAASPKPHTRTGPGRASPLRRTASAAVGTRMSAYA